MWNGEPRGERTGRAGGRRALILLLGALGCGPTMEDQPRYDPLDASPFFEDGRAARPQVEGTVARGQLRLDAHLYEGLVEGEPAATFPFPVTAEGLARGRERYDIYCAPCHDRVGGGRGMGRFAGGGVGKSMLLGMMTRTTAADVVVVGLIGERGREVREFIDTALGPEGLRKAVVVATPADDTPLMRLHGAWLSAAIAEYFRDQGQDVLLLMDSLTRFAMAQREIGLAAGEPPASRGYPPSMFGVLPKLVERAGRSERGSITAFYSALVEGDDPNDPIADPAREVHDGHIVLPRVLAESGYYPAIDIEASISRLLPLMTAPEHHVVLR